MDLREWLDSQQMTGEDLAHQMGCSAGTVYKWLRGDFKPSKHLMRILAQLTHGIVTKEDF